ncbi:MAG: ATP-binding cassette domain-containing protein [Deltaproteobacteria bacterium]|nr:ATP-binding cassette domain-containing protein [Deltaproteobacteria bacterium]
MISLTSVEKSFPDNQVLRDISFDIQRGERVSLTGPGGCGKTLILKILLGLVKADRGDVYLYDQDMTTASASEKEAVMKKTGMAFQQGGLFDFMSVRENIEFAMKHMTDYSPEYMLKRCQQLLEGVRLAKTENMYPHELSGGMKRRVGIARALCTDPVIALFDEPTSGLDPVTSTIILNMIQDLAGKEGHDKTLLIATSNVEIAVRFAERVIVLNEGTVVADGLWRDLLLNGPEWVRHFLGVRFIGLDLEYARELKLPEEFIRQHWNF